MPRNVVMLPEIDAEAHLALSIAALEQLETLYETTTPNGYVFHCFSELEKNSLSVAKTMAGLAVRSCTVDQLFEAMPLSEVAARLSDALSLTVYGRTVADELEHRQAKARAAIERTKAVRDVAEAKNG